MKDQNEVIANYSIWLAKRAKLLSRYFGEPVEDCYQSLCLYLLQYHSQATAWRKVFDDLQRAEKNTNGLDYHRYHRSQKEEHPPHADVDRADLLDYLSPLARQCVDLYWSGHTHAEISKLVEISARKAGRIIQKSLEIIRDLLGES